MEEENGMDICGMDPEDGYHAVMTCTKARALRLALRDVWTLLPEIRVGHTVIRAEVGS